RKFVNELSLFGKVIGDRKASWVGIKQAMSNIWRLSLPMEVKELGHNFFQFLFQNKEDKERVAKGTNWNFDNQYLILTEWFYGLSINHPIFQEVSFWVQVYNIPLNWLSTAVGLKLGSVFKKLKNVVVVGAGSHGGHILRLLVSINISEPIPRCATIRLGDWLSTVSFKYEKLVSMCHYCGVIGHLERNCDKRQQDIISKYLKEGQYGDWLRAPECQNFASLNLSDSRSPSSTNPTTPAQQSPLKSSRSQAEGSNQIMLMQGESSHPRHLEAEVSTSFCGNDRASKPPTTDLIQAEGNNRELVLQESSPLNPLNAAEVETSKNMEIEAVLVDATTSSDPPTFKLCLTSPAVSGPTKTWKRDRTKDGRLQREPVLPILIDKEIPVKRQKNEEESPSHQQGDQVAGQSDNKKSKLNSGKVEITLCFFSVKGINITRFLQDSTLKRNGSTWKESEIVTSSWSQQVTGTPFFKLKEKVKNTRAALLIWSSKFRSKNQQSIDLLTKKLEVLREDKAEDYWEQWNETRSELNAAHKQEELHWQQRSKVKWLKEGDSNTKFFHAYTLQKRKLNAISRLLTPSGSVLTSHEDIENHISEFYSELFTSEGSWDGELFTGQKVNLQKSGIFFSRNTPSNLRDSICNVLQGIVPHRSTRYLGLPLGIGRSKKEAFDFI
ncbi:Unknown protein, partial [Striga hermonthica]